MSRPLVPTYRNEKSRIEEHWQQMKEARRRYPSQPICPDCYQPPYICTHLGNRGRR